VECHAFRCELLTDLFGQRLPRELLVGIIIEVPLSVWDQALGTFSPLEVPEQNPRKSRWSVNRGSTEAR
jgi:hypothetical protein